MSSVAAAPRFTKDKLEESVTIKVKQTHVMDLEFCAWPKPKVRHVGPTCCRGKITTL